MGIQCNNIDDIDDLISKALIPFFTASTRVLYYEILDNFNYELWITFQRTTNKKISKTRYILMCVYNVIEF